MTYGYKVAIRAWQNGANHPGNKNEAFNREAYEARLMVPIGTMIVTAGRDLQRIAVIVNTDDRFPKFLGEKPFGDGTTPTTRALEKDFGDTIDILTTPHWGNNAGSAAAATEVFRHCFQDPDTDVVLSWNPEMAIDGYAAAEILRFMETCGLDICGRYHQDHFLYPQCMMQQNTCCAYTRNVFETVGGFSERCDGNNHETIDVDGFGACTLAGMDDGHFVATYLRKFGRFPRIGMTGRAAPAFRQTEFPGQPDRQRDFHEKLARQFIVLEAWVKELCPDLSFATYLRALFTNIHVD